MAMIYGITGEKGHGKDTLAKMMVSYNSDFKIDSFAKDLKDMAQRIFCLTQNQLCLPALKEKPLEKAIAMDNYIEGMSRETGLIVFPKNKVAHTPREIMQYFGTEYIRSIRDDYWVSRLVSRTTGLDHTIIPDVRMPNEAEAVRSLGGKIIKVVRQALSRNSFSEHESERVERIIPDITLYIKEHAFGPMVLLSELLANGDLHINGKVF